MHNIHNTNPNSSPPQHTRKQAHYNELDFAKAYGVCPNLVRVSVGLEDVEVRLCSHFDVLLMHLFRVSCAFVCHTSNLCVCQT